jgi:hypothetical protein
MLALGNAGHGGTRLALAARAQHDRLVALQILVVFLIVVFEIAGKVTRFHGRIDNAVHGPARHHEVAPGVSGGIGDGADARHI